MKNKKMMKVRASGVVITILILLIIIYGCFIQIRKNLQKELQQTLKDVATQNVIAVEKELTDKHLLLQGLASEITELPSNPKVLLDALYSFVEVYDFKRIGLVYPNGVTYTTDGHINNLAFRDFVNRGLHGKSMITDALEDSLSDDNSLINVISVPIYSESSSEVIGVLFATYQTEQFQNSLNVESFDGLGYSYLIQTDGTIITSSEQAKLHRHANAFRSILSYDKNNLLAINQMKKDIAAGKSNGIHYNYYGKRDAYYMPLNIMDGDVQWYMITAVPSQVLTDRLAPVLKIVIAFLFFIIVVVILSFFLYIYSHHKVQKELIRLAYEDPVTGGSNFSSPYNQVFFSINSILFNTYQ